ncbi:MAG: methylenetetrahydrofolate--tRNA-(uracil(54)-C(5))-methyltransferase (FADH(2)-oxidizing) TrmFO [Clostridiales bacterium]|nr:methylenetetrahydrofolate--tRNA-(uracil(54)-C(5))-methyltransferase (FADH(2)-oxidizing) TrmFO [Clostridiales bacterium]
MKEVIVIGGGLAGTESAYYLANKGIKVKLYDIKPNKFTPAHTNENYAELVCSNSLKSNDVYGNACGLLKEELRILGSMVIEVADSTKVPAGNALAVNREDFASIITEKIKNHPNIECFSEEIEKIPLDKNVIVATGPLTTDKLSEHIKELTGDGLYFFDAAAPIVEKDSIDFSSAFYGDRYGKGNGDHINCPMNKEEYTLFIRELINAKKAPQKDFEKKAIFEGCMPVEVMAERGENTLRFGPLKPTGLDDPKTGRWPYACLQLRKENASGDMYNLVGFQTNLLFPEQKRVFSLIPALKNAEFLRYGVMHKNTFINSPKVLNNDFSLKEYPFIFFAGQISGVEGYVESIASGLVSAISMERKLNGKPPIDFTNKTVIGALSNYVATVNENFQPMNANFGILPNLQIRDKKQKKEEQAKISLAKIKEIVKEM